MKLAHNPETGEYLGLIDGQWQPVKVARNDAGDLMALGADGWEPSGRVSTPSQPAGEPAPAQQPQTAEAPAQTPAEEAAGGGALRQLGLGTRSMLQGAGDIVDIVGNPIRALGNYASGALGGDPNLFHRGTGDLLADLFRLPEAQTPGERLAGATVRGGTGALATAGIGSLPAVARTVPAIASALSTAPAVQGASGAAAGLASEAAAQSGAGPAGTIGAGIAASLAPGVLAGTAVPFAKGVFDYGASFFPRGQRMLAGRILNRAAGDAADAVSGMVQADPHIADPLVPGSNPTLAQVTQNPGLAAMERIAEQKGTQGAPIAQRLLEQREAQNAMLREVGDQAAGRIHGKAQALASNLPRGLSADESGSILRGVYDRNLSGAKQAVSRAYDAIDPNGTARFNPQDLVDAYKDLVGPSEFAQMNVPGGISKYLGRLQDMAKNGEALTYQDMQAIRTELAGMARQASGVGGDPNVARIAGGWKSSLDNILGTQDGGYGFDPAQMNAFNQAKALRTEMAKDFQQGANRAMGGYGDAAQSGRAVADGSIPARYFNAKPTAGDDMAAFQASMKGSPQAEDALLQYGRGSFRDSVLRTGPEGAQTADPVAMAKWRQQHAQALSAFPRLDAETADALRRARDIAGQQAGLKTSLRQNGDGWSLRRGVDIDGRFAGTYTPDELSRLQAVQKDASRVSRTGQLAQVHGSPTARNLYGIGDSLGAILPNVNRVPFLNRALGQLTQTNTDRIWDQVVAGMLDPRYGAQLMRGGGSAPRMPLDMMKKTTQGAGLRSLLTLMGGQAAEGSRIERGKGGLLGHMMQRAGR
jgi:hypothetical protein